MGELSDLFPFILVSTLAALGTAPLFIALSRRFGLLDIPGSAPHKQHRTPTPQAGGMVLLISVASACLLLPIDRNGSVTGILLTSLAFMLWGVADDRLALKPALKLIGQIALATLPIAFGIQVRVTQVGILDLFLTLLWFVGIVNAFNFVDSMDGLAVGLGASAAAFFMLATLSAGQEDLALLAAANLGGAIGLYFYNSSPAKLFLGDSGAQFLGISIASLGVAYVPAGAGLPQALSWFTPILVLGIPLFDTGLVIVSRLRRAQPIYVGRNDHTYHRLVALGWPPARSVAAMHIGAIVLGLLAFVVLDLSVLTANLIFLVSLLIGAAGLVYLERVAPIP